MSDARSVLLAALDHVEQMEKELDGEVAHLAVAWTVRADGKHGGGWNATDDPAWLVEALFRTTADQVAEGAEYADEPGDEPDGDD